MSIKKTMSPRIWITVPYCHKDEGKRKGRDLGFAYNQYANMIPDGDWLCSIDHDACFLTKGWFRMLESAVAEKPDAGMFVVNTNRLRPRKSGWQLYGDKNCHDISVLRKQAVELFRKYGAELEDVTEIESKKWRPSSGFFMLISKEIWQNVIGELHGMYKLDYLIFRKLVESKLKVYRIKGLLMYHWFNGKRL